MTFVSAASFDVSAVAMFRISFTFASVVRASGRRLIRGPAYHSQRKRPLVGVPCAPSMKSGLVGAEAGLDLELHAAGVAGSRVLAEGALEEVGGVPARRVGRVAGHAAGAGAGVVDD